ncbi:MAG TPA: ABC transporter ATP-binding protein, partial [Firmicutes bacterium]|nr:ABC transporter ATP-binding protein [Bacillota bacterium]
MNSPVIQMKDVTLTFTKGKLPELSGIDFGIYQGEIVSLVGPSGCGKSTLLRLIAGVIPPTHGEVMALGQKAAPGWPGLGFVPQDSLLLPWRTVAANVELPLEIQGETDKIIMGSKVKKALELANLSDSEHKYPHQLSGGMRQRAALARALVGDTQILMLDEPFAALDDITRTGLHLELLDMQLRTGATILLVTHNIFEAVFLSRRVIVMGEKPGRIVAEVEIGFEYPRPLKIIGNP